MLLYSYTIPLIAYTIINYFIFSTLHNKLSHLLYNITIRQYAV
nr:MAG TPA: hypothetical protein [Caudoviricetes sp.]